MVCVSLLKSLSGTPAEAGVRVDPRRSYGSSRGVSVEPLPKQGCESASHADYAYEDEVSVEPLPKQGCESAPETQPTETISLSGTPAEAGVRAILPSALTRFSAQSQWNPCRSRGARIILQSDDEIMLVSVEPLPKQGCESPSRMP